SIFGLALAHARYADENASRQWTTRLRDRLDSVHALFYQRLHFNLALTQGVTRPVQKFSRLVADFDQQVVDGAVRKVAWLFRLLSRLSGLFDDHLLDGIVRLVGRAILRGGRTIRRLQTGHVNAYLFIILVSLTLLLLVSVFAC